jgi:hypothetical protein
MNHIRYKISACPKSDIHPFYAQSLARPRMGCYLNDRKTVKS